METESTTRAEPESTVAEIMAHLAAGDVAWVYTLKAHHGTRIAATVRRILVALGQSHIARDAAEVDDIVDEVCFDVLFDKARSWRPDGGALPWVWAEKAIRSLVVARVGHRRAHIDEETLAALPDPSPMSPPSPPSHSGATGDVWTETCRRDARLALLDEAVAAVTNGRDRAVFVEYVLQKSLDDPSPANTVAAMVGLTPANVRKIHQRVRRRLTELIRSDPMYTPLRGLAILVR